MTRDDIIGVIEPVMPLSERFGDYLLCFGKRAVVLDQSYSNMQRYLLDFKARIDCPTDFKNKFLDLRKKYGGVVKYSFPTPVNQHDFVAHLFGLPF